MFVDFLFVCLGAYLGCILLFEYQTNGSFCRFCHALLDVFVNKSPPRLASKIIGGFKILNHDMTAMNELRYHIGKTYIHEDRLEMCRSGFHFCQRLSDCVYFVRHLKSPSRFFRVLASGDNIRHATERIFYDQRQKSVTDEITLTKELTADEVAKILSYDTDANAYAFFKHCMIYQRDFALAILRTCSEQRTKHFAEMALFLDDHFFVLKQRNTVRYLEWQEKWTARE